MRLWAVSAGGRKGWRGRWPARQGQGVACGAGNSRGAERRGGAAATQPHSQPPHSQTATAQPGSLPRPSSPLLSSRPDVEGRSVSGSRTRGGCPYSDCARPRMCGCVDDVGATAACVFVCGAQSLHVCVLSVCRVSLYSVCQPLTSPASPVSPSPSPSAAARLCRCLAVRCPAAWLFLLLPPHQRSSRHCIADAAPNLSSRTPNLPHPRAPAPRSPPALTHVHTKPSHPLLFHTSTHTHAQTSHPSTRYTPPSLRQQSRM